MKEILGKTLLVILAALAPIHAVLITAGVLVFADMVTGIWASIKKGIPFKSAHLRRTISKMLIYHIAIISAFLLETYLLQDFIPITKIVGGVIGLVEFTSIMENANTITGTNVFKLILQRLGSQNDIRELVEKKKD